MRTALEPMKIFNSLEAKLVLVKALQAALIWKEVSHYVQKRSIVCRLLGQMIANVNVNQFEAAS